MPAMQAVWELVALACSSAEIVSKCVQRLYRCMIYIYIGKLYRYMYIVKSA